MKTWALFQLCGAVHHRPHLAHGQYAPAEWAERLGEDAGDDPNEYPGSSHWDFPGAEPA